jgi:L,D-transpeptidase YcbB
MTVDGMSGVVRLITVLLLCWCDYVWALGDIDLILSEQMRVLLQHRFAAVVPVHRMMVQGRELHATETLLRFYTQRQYQPAWSDGAGPMAFADVLLKSIAGAEQEGLRSEDYHQNAIANLLKQVRPQPGIFQPLDAVQLADLDLLLSDAFLMYGTHLLSGRVNPETIQAQWYTERRQGDLAHALQQALDAQQIDEVLRTFLPPQPGYHRLKQALGRYRTIATQGGWSQVSAGPNT